MSGAKRYMAHAQEFVPAKLSSPTVAQIEAVTDVLEHRWSSNALMVQDRLTHAIERDDHNAAAKWALAGGISTDKVLILKGRPTDIVGHVHAVRHEIGPLMDRLARVLRPELRPVTDVHLSSAITVTNSEHA